MTLDEFNQASSKKLEKNLFQCCGAKQWVKQVINNRPYSSYNSLETSSLKIWSTFKSADWLEAFAQHPQIGDLSTLRKKFSHTAKMAAVEQSGTESASTWVLEDLSEKNKVYLEKFGYIFIICATGKSALEMLNALNQRLSNDKAEEIRIAAGEQIKITTLRLKKLIK